MAKTQVPVERKTDEQQICSPEPLKTSGIGDTMTVEGATVSHGAEEREKVLKFLEGPLIPLTHTSMGQPLPNQCRTQSSFSGETDQTLWLWDMLAGVLPSAPLL